MERKLNIRVRKDFDVFKSVLNTATYIDSGASKQAYLKDGICYKIPIGYEELSSDSFTTFVEYPYELEDYERFIYDTVSYYHESLVWSIGQIVFEIIVWEHLKELEGQGYDISGFAAIKDYYIDCNGIPVIEQEFIYRDKEIDRDLPCVCGETFRENNRKTLDALADMGFELTDLRGGNMAYNNDGVLKCFDFGISSGSAIYDYDTYDSCCNGDSYYYDDEQEEEEEIDF